MANSALLKDGIGKQVAALTADLPAEMVAAAFERGRSLDLWETAAEILDELGELGWEAGDI
jgi:hypothetical protein